MTLSTRIRREVRLVVRLWIGPSVMTEMIQHLETWLRNIPPHDIPSLLRFFATAPCACIQVKFKPTSQAWVQTKS